MVSLHESFDIECVHMTSQRPCWRSKQRNGGHVGKVKYSLGIELYFYANSSFCFIMQIWLLHGDMSEHNLEARAKRGRPLYRFYW